MFQFEDGGVWSYQRCSNLIVSSPYFYPVEHHNELFGSYFVVNSIYKWKFDLNLVFDTEHRLIYKLAENGGEFYHTYTFDTETEFNPYIGPAIISHGNRITLSGGSDG